LFNLRFVSVEFLADFACTNQNGKVSNAIAITPKNLQINYIQLTHKKNKLDNHKKTLVH